jgi:hypothetical protein
MTKDEFDLYRRRAIREYATEHVRARDWSREDAARLAAEETDGLLPDGVDSAGMVLLVAEVDGDSVGHVWVGESPGERVLWWISACMTRWAIR